MDRKKLRRPAGWHLLAAGLMAWLPTAALAQTADALVEKLIQKGILTQEEADALRQEARPGPAPAAMPKTAVADWVEAIRFKGDFRGRFDALFAEDPAYSGRNALRYRLRLGAVITLNHGFLAGLRVASGEPTGGFGGNPISGNTSFRDNGSKKFLWVDQAYASWIPLEGNPAGAGLTVGKMENPFVLSDLAFDSDYTPEGVAGRFSYEFGGGHRLALNLGGFALDEISASADDPFLLGAQLRHEAKWNPQWQTAAGLAVLAITADSELSNGAVPNINAGNTRTPDGLLARHFNPLVADLEVTHSLESFPLYPGRFPVSARAEAIHNPAAPTDRTGFAAGIAFGKLGGKSTWDLAYRYRWIEADAWYEELLDSDAGAFYAAAPPDSGLGAGFGAGTNLKGHTVRIGYAPYDAIALGLTWNYYQLILNPAPTADSGLHRLQLDATWKF